MPRSRRHRVSQDVGSFHIISRVVGGQLLFKDNHKEFFLTLLDQFAAGFFVEIHAFCIMDNHFHILATCLEKESRLASREELLRRYHLIFGEKAEPPAGSYDSCNQLIPDADDGEERLRRRLGSISRFVQELKQNFSRWYNKHNGRSGYLWGERFKGVIVSKGEGQLACSAYIDLNPVRAGLVKKPEDYRWSSLGLRVLSPSRVRKLLRPLSILPGSGDIDEGVDGTANIEPPFTPIILNKGFNEYFYDHFDTYREFVHKTGGIGSSESESAGLWPKIMEELVAYHGTFGITDRFRNRIRNISEGIALGNYALISDLQRSLKRKYIRPRSFVGKDSSCRWAFTTRVLRL